MRFKLFEEFLNEGINDPGILKVFFMAGGPGSGKSFVATELFGFTKGAMSTVSYATGLKLVNNDNAFERELEKAGLDASKLADYAADPEMWDNIVMPLRNKAKGITKRMQDNYIAGRLGQVVDGTGKDYKKIQGLRKLYQDLGYDTYMVFVNTSEEVALERNRNRKRKLADEMVALMWRQVQDNLGKFQKLFGANNMLIVDNSSYDNEDILDQIEKAVMSRMNKPVKNPIGKKWMQENSPQNRKRNQPFGVRESVDERRINRKKLSDDLWDRKGYDYKYLDKLSDKKLKSLWDTEFYYESANEAKFTDYDNNELAAYLKNNPKDKEAAKELSKRSKKLRDLSRTDESVNEAVSISAKMPASMKKWIMGEVKSNPDTWSNELTDLTNEIVSIYREMDLDLMKSEAGPEWVNVRELPVSELTSRCVETINDIWPQMSEWAKEYIYADYSHWFKVTKKDRPHYGETE